MPEWLILALAGVVLVAGAGGPTLLRLRRARRRGYAAAVADVRARIEALDYRIDGLPAGPAATRAGDLRDTAQALLSVADRRRSVRVCRDADAVVARAEAAVARVQGSRWP